MEQLENATGSKIVKNIPIKKSSHLECISIRP